MYKKSFVHCATKTLVDILFYGGILFCCAIPFIMPYLARRFRYDESAVLQYNAILMLSGICALYILRQLKAMFKSLVGGNPFTNANIMCLRRCSAASFALSLIYIIKIIFWFTITSFIIVVIFALLGLFCLTLKDVFKQAVAYKEENDWTV